MSSERREAISSSPSGCAPIYTSSTASDHRASLNARAQIRRADREARCTLDVKAMGGGHG